MGINTHKLMNKTIILSHHGREIRVPNSWELLTSTQYLKLVNYLLRMDRGELSPAEVRIYFLCDLLGLDVHKVERGMAMENLLAISEQLTFLFRNTTRRCSNCHWRNTRYANASTPISYPIPTPGSCSSWTTATR